MARKTKGGNEPDRTGPQHEDGEPLTCGKCGGGGWIGENKQVIIDGKPSTEVVSVKCSQCKGTGQMR